MNNNIVLRFREVDRDKFNDIILGRKTIETRAATVKYRKIQQRDNLVIVCGNDRIVKQVKRIERYESLEETFKNINFNKILPNAGSVDMAMKIYNSFPGYKEKIKQNGLLAFYV